MASEKIVRRVPAESSPESDLIGLIDLIEIELDLSTGRKSVRTRLTEVASQLRDGIGTETSECLDTLLDAIGRLEKIEGYMQGYGLKTAREWIRPTPSQ